MRQYLGPSVGWADAPAPSSILSITTAGTFTILPGSGITLVNVNVVGAVTLVLPPATFPAIPAIGAPGRFTAPSVTVTDVGGHAQAFPITIQAAAGDSIVSLASVLLSSNFGGFTLTPVSAQHLWEVIAP